jgi:hypothetical protein
MNNDNNKFNEQEAPLKNTDNAFVKVSDDGSPVTDPTSDKKTDTEKEENITTLDKR